MDRRAFVGTLAGGFLTAPLAAQAQQPGKVFRIGLLGTVPLTDPAASRLWGGFVDGLRQLGYVEGQNAVIEGRFSEGRSERFPTLAAELVRLKVDVIVAAAYAPNAAKSATSTIPIVMTNHADPVGSGLAASLARPGGNVTGLTALAPDLVGKQLQLLKEAMSRPPRVAVLFNPANPNHPAFVRNAEAAARALEVRLYMMEVGLRRSSPLPSRRRRRSRLAHSSS